MNIYGGLILLTAIVASLTALVGCIVLVRNASHKLNRYLFIMAVSFASWMLANVFSNLDLDEDLLLLINRLLFVFSSIAVTFLPLVLMYLTARVSIRTERALIVLGASIALLAFSPMIASGVIPTQPVVEIVFGPLAGLYFLYILVSIAVSIIISIRAFRVSRGRLRSQLQVIAWSALVPLVLGTLTNVVLPFFFGEYEPSLVGPLFFSIMIIGFGYSIVQQHLFDIRLIISRSITYIFVIGIVSIVYIIGAHSILLALQFWSGDVSSIAIESFLSVLIVLFLPAFIRLVSKASDQLLHSSSMSIQDFMTHLNTLLITARTIEELYTALQKLLDVSLKPEFVVLAVRKNKGIVLLRPSGKEIRIEKIPSRKGIEIVQTELTSDRTLSKLRKAYGVDIVCCLDSQSGVEGLLLLGYKRNGTAYSTQDIKLLSYARGGIGLALSNAKKYEEILLFNETMKQKVASATDKLRRANKDLSSLNALKDDFISAASHQLKPQITSAGGFIDLAMQESMPKQLSTLLALSRKGLSRMASIVEGVLDQARVGEIELNKVNFSMSALVVDEIKSLKVVALRKNVEIIHSISPKLYYKGDRDKLREAIFNVLHNAVVYSFANAQVAVALVSTDKGLRLTVADSGIGITNADKKEIFKKHYRSGNAQAHHLGGSGVGLYVSKMFIEAHGGTILVSKNSPKGTVFTVEL